MKHKTLSLFIVLVGWLALNARFSVAAPAAPIVHPDLAETMQQQPAQMTAAIVILREQVDVQSISGHDPNEHATRVIQALQAKAAQTQARTRALLAAGRTTGQVQSYTPLWIINAVAFTANASMIEQLAQLPEVSGIVPDRVLYAPQSAPRLRTLASPESNLTAINAPALWTLGYRGKGVVVASMDTGVDYGHPDLAAQWRGGSNSWYDPNGQHPTAPYDANGHGTWTMGVMVGGDHGGTSIGVAPEAAWIAVKIFNDSGTATSSVIHLGYQWLLDPDSNPQTADAPDVVNNSWTFSAPGCNLDFQQDLQVLAAANITPVFAAGNFGPNQSTSASPANNPGAFAVGAVDNSNSLYTNSSRGPTSCGGAARTFPDVVAAGVNVRTTDLYGMYYAATGTSLSAAQVSGALALLLNAYPDLSVAQQRSALTSSALDLGTAGADNNFGAGRIDVLGAYNTLAGNPPPPATATPPAATATPSPTPTSVPTLTPTPTPAPSDAIFTDGFESGNLNAWSSAATGGGRLSVSTSAALVGAWGMQTLINSTTPFYVTDASPAAEATYHARFYFSPHGVSISNGKLHDLFAGRSASGAAIFRVQLRRSGGSYQVRGGVLPNSGKEQFTNWYPMSDATHAVEIAWQAATTAGGTNGLSSLWLDGALKQTIGSVANGNHRLEEIRLGPSAIDSGISGTEYFDAFASTRGTYIGP